MKPTLFERVISLFSSKMKEVLSDPCRIALIDNPSERLQMAAVRQSSSAVMFIDNPSSKVQSMAVVGNPIYIRLINKPTEMVKNIIIDLDARNISLIDNPSPQLQLKAVKKNPETIKLIENPSVEAVYHYINGDYSKLADIQNIPLSIQKRAISVNPLNAQYIRNLDKDLQKETLELTSRILNKSDKAEQVQPSNAQSFYKSYTSFEESYASEIQDIQKMKISETEKSQKIENIKEAIKESKILAVQTLSNNLGNNINVKNLFKNISQSNIEPEQLKAGEWMQLLSTGKCKIENTVLEINLLDDNIISVTETQTVYSPKKDNEVVSENFLDKEISETSKKNIDVKSINSPKNSEQLATELEEKFGDIKRKVDYKSLVKSVEKTGINPSELNTENWRELIKKGNTSLKDYTLNLKKTPSGYNVTKSVLSKVSAPVQAASAVKRTAEKLNAEAEIQN